MHPIGNARNRSRLLEKAYCAVSADAPVGHGPLADGVKLPTRA